MDLSKILLTHGGDVYSFDKGEIVLDLSSNINYKGLPGGVKKALAEHMDEYERYPDPLCRELRSAISWHIGVDAANIVCGNGAADIIYRLVLALKPSKGLVTAPTFSEYEDAMRLYGCDVGYFQLEEGNGFNLNRDIIDKITPGVDLVFICNPNNPTGAAFSVELMRDVVERSLECGAYLVVDECFMDFCEEPERYSLLPFIANYPNLIILKAFTKTYAMAGIRLGYGICSEDTAALIACTMQPWSVSAVASVCGVYALKEKEYVSDSVLNINRNRQFLKEGLERLEIKVYDSRTNYLMFKYPFGDLKSSLIKYGILIRSCSNYKGLDSSFYRIAVKSMENCEYFIECMRELMRK